MSNEIPAATASAANPPAEPLVQPRWISVPPPGTAGWGGQILAAAIRLVCGVRELTAAPFPARPCILFANHTSHLDFVLIWASLPAALRTRTRPVAGRDYWEKTALRRWIATRVFRAVLIERTRVTVATNPLGAMVDALAQGDSLIVFPEGTRSHTGEMQAFKGGLYHLARAAPEAVLLPVWLDNLSRVLPKGEFLPVPLIATLAVGAPLTLAADESKPEFLTRARDACVRLSGMRS